MKHEIGDIWKRYSAQYDILNYSIIVVQLSPVKFEYTELFNAYIQKFDMTDSQLLRDFRKLTKLEKAMK